MAACQTAIPRRYSVLAKNHWIARRILRFARRTHSNRCLRRFQDHTSSCVSRIITTSSRRTTRITNETGPFTGAWQPSAGAGCTGDRVNTGVAAALPQMNETQDSPLVAILGPTASGKSALGIWLAQQLGGDVVACDSTQLYRGFDVGTAKPAPEDRGGVAHHLIDVLDGSEEATAGDYRVRAIEVLETLSIEKRLPIFTVGTGLYLRALLEGLADVPVRSEPLRQRLRESAAKGGPGHLHKVLQRLDAAAAKKIASADEQKLIRAVEVCLLTRKPLTEVYQSGRKRLEGWRAIKIGLAPERKA